METNEKLTLTPKQNFLQAIKFALFSATAGIIQATSFAILNETMNWQYWPSYLIALTLSVLYNFTINRKFTFKSAANVPIAMLKVFGFYLVFTPISTILGNFVKENLGVNEYIVLAATMVSNLVTEFLFCRFVVYKDSINTSSGADKK
ncbi:MAG TPA: GtrA family protein [Oscillospiraceae bacterium]|nr:GtrA family protein [Oscillospiraceae bacterium]